MRAVCLLTVSTGECEPRWDGCPRGSDEPYLGKALACGLHHNRHGRCLASACWLNGDGKAFCNHTGSFHFVEHHAVAFAIRLEPTGGHGSAAVCGQEPELVDLVFRQRSQVV